MTPGNGKNGKKVESAFPVLLQLNKSDSCAVRFLSYYVKARESKILKILTSYSTKAVHPGTRETKN